MARISSWFADGPDSLAQGRGVDSGAGLVHDVDPVAQTLVWRAGFASGATDRAGAKGAHQESW